MLNGVNPGHVDRRACFRKLMLLLTNGMLLLSPWLLYWQHHILHLQHCVSLRHLHQASLPNSKQLLDHRHLARHCLKEQRHLHLTVMTHSSKAGTAASMCSCSMATYFYHMSLYKHSICYCRLSVICCSFTATFSVFRRRLGVDGVGYTPAFFGTPQCVPTSSATVEAGGTIFTSRRPPSVCSSRGSASFDFTRPTPWSVQGPWTPSSLMASSCAAESSAFLESDPFCDCCVITPTFSFYCLSFLYCGK